MVENKRSIYDSEEQTPLVQADHVEPDMDPLVVAEVYAAENGAAELLPPVEAQLPVIVDEKSNEHKEAENESSGESNELDQDGEKRRRELVTGASVASGVFGCLLGGPILALLLGYGAAYACKREGAAGDAARAIGEVALVFRQKAKALDDKHRLVEKAKTTASDTLEKAKEADEKYHILERTKTLVVKGFVASKEFVSRHRLIERGVEQVSTAINWAADKLAEKMQESNENTTFPTSDAATTEPAHPF